MSSNPLQTSISPHRDERIEVVLKKLKGLGASTTSQLPTKTELTSTPSTKYIIPSRRTPSPQPQASGKYVIPSRRTPSPPPQVPETAPRSPLIIIYSAETHQPFPSPPPKRFLLPTFPRPPQIDLPHESKIAFPRNTISCASEALEEEGMLGCLFEAVAA